MTYVRISCIKLAEGAKRQPSADLIVYYSAHTPYGLQSVIVREFVCLAVQPDIKIGNLGLRPLYRC